jgi:predicted DNA-binding protein
MAGKIGRPRVDDPKMNVPNYSLRQSTLIEIDLLSERLKKSRSEILQIIIENGINIVKGLSFGGDKI